MGGCVWCGCVVVVDHGEGVVDDGGVGVVCGDCFHSYAVREAGLLGECCKWCGEELGSSCRVCDRPMARGVFCSAYCEGVDRLG